MENTLRNSLYGFEIRETDKRRAPSGERKTYDVKQLWQRSHEILRLALVVPKHKEIARLLGISEATVSNTLNSELGRKKLSKLRLARDNETLDVAKRVAELLPKAIDTYERILDGDPTITKMMKETADTISMDIGGYRAPTKTQTATLHMTPAELAEFKERGKAAARSAGLIVEAELVGETNESS
jgi:predicted transcriptional regulator